MTRPRAAALAAADEPAWVRGVVIATAIAFVGLFVLVPLAAVFREALRAGLAAYGRAISDPVALAAARLTLATDGLSRGDSAPRRSHSGLMAIALCARMLNALQLRNRVLPTYRCGA